MQAEVRRDALTGMKASSNLREMVDSQVKSSLPFAYMCMWISMLGLNFSCSGIDV